MKKIYVFTLLWLSTIATLGQDVPNSFPRKFLLEHFTTEQCGICPMGMEAIVDHVQTQNPSLIWVGHHTGYGKDEYTITENLKIASLFGVNQAPLVVLNRTIQKDNATPFSPMDLPHLDCKDDTMAEASVCIHHTFDAETRQLDITVSGQVANTETTSYLLTILIKENYLIGPQEDYYGTWKQSPWREFMHTRVVRDMVSNSAYGDTVTIENQSYSQTLSYIVDEEWVAENCCIVAYITSLEKKPIINAEQVPLVAGTTGGEEYMPYGITESAKPQTTIAFDTIHITQVSDTLLEMLLIDNSAVRSAYGYPVQPVARVYLNTEATTLQVGTYPVQTDREIGSITAGYRNDLETMLEGSLLMYIPTQKIKQGDFTPDSKWRIDKGEMVVETDGTITFNFTTYNKTSVSTSAINPITTVDKIISPANTPKKLLRNNQLIILHNEVEYNILGNTIQ